VQDPQQRLTADELQNIIKVKENKRQNKRKNKRQRRRKKG
jgi:hypothetical protein